MDQNRRSMAAAIQMPPPRVVSLINEGTPKPLTSALSLSPSSAEKSEEKTAVVPEMVALNPSIKPKAQKERVAEVVTTVQFGIRIPSDLSLTLLKSSSERKLKKIRPYTQQDIIAEALSDWLHKNGYLQ